MASPFSGGGFGGVRYERAVNSPHNPGGPDQATVREATVRIRQHRQARVLQPLVGKSRERLEAGQSNACLPWTGMRMTLEVSQERCDCALLFLRLHAVGRRTGAGMQSGVRPYKGEDTRTAAMTPCRSARSNVAPPRPQNTESSCERQALWRPVPERGSGGRSSASTPCSAASSLLRREDFSDIVHTRLRLLQREALGCLDCLV